jgi:hypothetical protein
MVARIHVAVDVLVAAGLGDAIGRVDERTADVALVGAAVDIGTSRGLLLLLLLLSLLLLGLLLLGLLLRSKEKRQSSKKDQKVKIAAKLWQ